VQNGLAGLRMLVAEEIKEFEPYAAGIRGIHVPGTGIVDYVQVAEAYARLILNHGGTIHLSHEVTELKRSEGNTLVETTHGTIRTKLVINCAGLQSDRVSRMANAALHLTIVPFRGEYYEIIPAKRHYLRGLLYPVPDPRFPFLGVHFTRRIGGGVEAGPNAVLALKREGYDKSSFNLRDVFEYARFPGFWKMGAKHWRMSIGEYHRSWSKPAFVHALQRLMPELEADDLIPGGSGVRAQALDAHGNLMDDFYFVHADGMVLVCNVPSPAATASLAIGKYIVDTVIKHHGSDLDQKS
jgi:L-2-hydroxyglutarate oxidase LhgO